MLYRHFSTVTRNQNIFKTIGSWYNSIYGRKMPGEMERVTVRCVEGDEFLTLSYLYGNKHSNMLRPKTEPLQKSLDRIKANIIKLAKKGNKKSKKTKLDLGSSQVNQNQQNQNLEVECILTRNGVEVDKTLLNKDAWIEGSVLRIQDRTYEVCKNLPTVLSLKLPTKLMVGCPVYPRVDVEFAQHENCLVVWYQSKISQLSLGNKSLRNDGATHHQIEATPDVAAAVPMEVESTSEVLGPMAKIKAVGCQWAEVSRERVLVPTEDMLGSKLKLQCVPRNSQRQGVSKEVISASGVTTSPGVFPFEKRHEFTKEKLPAGWVVCYNILADMYADSDFSRDVLYPYCPAEVLDINYREQIILKELTGYNADIVCLQEVGKRFFQQSLVPSLISSGLQGLLKCKHGQVPEGEAIFYHIDRFRLVEEHNIVLSEALKQPYNSDLLDGVSRNGAMLKRFNDQATICQVAILKHLAQPTQKPCIVNTHLYFHPRAAHIRLLQSAIIMRHLEQIHKSYREESKGDLAIMLCGDLNSNPHSAVYEYITNKTIPTNTVDWYTSGKEEFCGGIPLQHTLQLTDACNDIDYTNFVAGFRAKLDHVFIQSPQLGVKGMVPMSSHEDVIKHVALPNEVFPSDHMALVCDIKWQ